MGNGGGVGANLCGCGGGGEEGCLAGGKISKHDVVGGAAYAALVGGIDGVL